MRGGSVVMDWDQIVRHLSVSSNDSQAYRLIDGNHSTYWQSSGPQGKHWVRLELQRNILVEQLAIQVRRHLTIVSTTSALPVSTITGLDINSSLTTVSWEHQWLYLCFQVEQSDSSYMPSVVAVLAGNTIGSLKEIKQVSVPSTCRECVLLSGITEVWLSTVTSTRSTVLLCESY